MEFSKQDIIADLGCGEFRVRRYVKTVGNKVSEVGMANGYLDRTIIGSETLILLEGEYEASTETEFFEQICSDANGMGIVGAEIDGVEYSVLIALKISLTRVEDSHLGKFEILLKEL